MTVAAEYSVQVYAVQLPEWVLPLILALILAALMIGGVVLWLFLRKSRKRTENSRDI